MAELTEITLGNFKAENQQIRSCITRSSTDPATLYGYEGTWGEIERHLRFAAYSNNSGTSDDIVTWNDTNTQNGQTEQGVSVPRSYTIYCRNNTLFFRFQFANKVALTDNSIPFLTIDLTKVGLTSGYNVYPVPFSDFVGAFIMGAFRVSGTTGTLYSEDVIVRGSSQANLPANVKNLIITDFLLETQRSIRDPDFCDYFMWVRND